MISREELLINYLFISRGYIEPAILLKKKRWEMLLMLLLSIFLVSCSVIAPTPNSYDSRGKLILDDPLRDNSQGYGWDEQSSNTGGDCKFTASGYDVLQSDPNYFNYCYASKTNLSNFAYEVQMTIIKGDAGGILFRADGAKGTFYYFTVSQDGFYQISLCPINPTCRDLVRSIPTSAINKGLKQVNLLAVVAEGDTFTIYVNHQQITSVKDGTYRQGQIGMIASPFATKGHATEVVYTNAKVWMF
jgi:hypothetical protein